MDFESVYNNLKCINKSNPGSYCGIHATAWVINYDNMDYLKFDSSGNGTCPNGSTPTESNPRCN